MEAGDIRRRGDAPSPPPGNRHHAIADLAFRQHGVVARRQLLAMGLSRTVIEGRRSAGYLHQLHLGVYAVGHGRLTQCGRWMAAVLACGDEAVLSHRSAAALWGIAPIPRAPVDVTVPTHRRGRRPGIRVDRTRTLRAKDRARRHSIPLTGLSRTLLDLAADLGDLALARILETADRLELLNAAELERHCDANGRRGTARLRRLLAQHRPLPETRSELERMFLRFCRQAGLPSPAANVPVAGFEVDAFWPDQRLVVELDGYEFHRTRRSFEEDRARDAALQLAGCRVLRVTKRRLTDEPSAVEATIRALLGGATT